MADARELLGAGEARRAGADDRDALAGAARGRLGLEPAFAPGAVDDRAFDRLDRHRRVLQVERAGGLARRRADAAGEFGEIVGAVQVARGLLPVVAIDQIVPVGDLVVHRTAVVTIGNAAVHAARGLIARRLFAERQDEFAIVADAVGRGRVAPIRPIDFHEAGHLAHRSAIPLVKSAITRAPTAAGASSRVSFPRRQHPHVVLRRQLGERAAIFDRHHLAELRQVGLPVLEDLRAPGSSRCSARGWRSAGAGARRRSGSCRS